MGIFTRVQLCIHCVVIDSFNDYNGSDLFLLLFWSYCKFTVVGYFTVVMTMFIHHHQRYFLTQENPE